MRRQASTTRAIALSAGVSVVLIYVVAALWYWPVYTNDDAYITFRYSWMLAHGHGPVFNPGEHVEGYTNFLLMLLIAGAIKLIGPDAAPAVAKGVGVIGGAVGIAAAAGLAGLWLRRVPRVRRWAGPLGWMAGALVAVNAAYVVNSVSGLETTLFAGLVTLGAYLLSQTCARGGWHGAGVALALAALTRPEGVMAAAVLGVAAVVIHRHKRPVRNALLLDALIVVAVVAAHATFRYLYYDGELAPNTYYAKMGGMSWRLSATDYLLRFVGWHLAGPAAVLCLAPLAGPPRLRRASAPAVVLLLAVVAGLYQTGPDWMLAYRLLAPYAPLWAALAVAGAGALAWRAPRPTQPTAVAIGVGLLTLLLAMQGARPLYYYDWCATRTRGYLNGHVAVSRWLANCPQRRPGRTVALMDIGIIGYQNPDLRVLDITGLTDRHIAKSPGGFLSKDYDPAYVLDQTPEYVVLVFTAGEREGTLRTWIVAEGRLMQHAGFAAYARPREAPPDADVAEQIAARIGAAAVFRHDHPQVPYWLAVFQRAD